MRRRAREYAYSSDTTSSDTPPSTRSLSDADVPSTDTPLYAFFADYRPAPMTCLPSMRPPPTCFRSDIFSTDTPPSPSLRRDVFLRRCVVSLLLQNEIQTFL